MPTSIIYCSHLQTVGFIFLGQGRLVSRPKQSPYHPAIRKCLLGVLRELYSKFGDYQAIFTTLTATQRLLISQPPLFSKEKLQWMEFFRKKKKAPKVPIKIAALCGLHHACHRAGRGNQPITACCNRHGNVLLFLLPLHPCSES